VLDGDGEARRGGVLLAEAVAPWRIGPRVGRPLGAGDLGREAVEVPQQAVGVLDEGLGVPAAPRLQGAATEAQAVGHQRLQLELGGADRGRLGVEAVHPDGRRAVDVDPHVGHRPMVGRARSEVTSAP
jgi:hypothetical protein